MRIRTAPQTTEGVPNDPDRDSGSRSRARDIRVHSSDPKRGVFRTSQGIRVAGLDETGTEGDVLSSANPSGAAGVQDSSGVDPLHILNTLGKCELEPLVSEQAAEAEQNLADVRDAFPVAVCNNCGEPIEYFPAIADPLLRWKHAYGLYGCRKSLGKTCATPIVVISSPAYFLPELKSDADHFAEQYRLEHDLPFSMLQHLAWAWLMGQQDERLKEGAR